MERIGRGFEERKALFHKGLKERRLTVEEIERALPQGSLSAAERWLFYACLRAAEVLIVDEARGIVDRGWQAPPSP